MTHRFITTGKLLASSLIISLAFSSTAMAQAKSTSMAPEVTDAIKPANTYGATRSNRSSNIAAPSGETPDVGDVTERANINTSRSNRLSSGIAAPSGETPDVGDGRINGVQPEIDSLRSIVAPAGCVTEAGAKDVNCDGLDDAQLIDGKREEFKKCMAAGKSHMVCKRGESLPLGTSSQF